MPNETLWFDADTPIAVPGRLVEDEDGEWAISNDPDLPEAGHLLRTDGDLTAVPGEGVGIPVHVRFVAPFVSFSE
jgi:hypothetical protein